MTVKLQSVGAAADRQISIMKTVLDTIKEIVPKDEQDNFRNP